MIYTVCSNYSERFCDLIGRMLTAESSQRPNITEVIHTLTQNTQEFN